MGEFWGWIAGVMRRREPGAEETETFFAALSAFVSRFYLIPFDVLLWLEGVQPEVVGK